MYIIRLNLTHCVLKLYLPNNSDLGRKFILFYLSVDNLALPPFFLFIYFSYHAKIFTSHSKCIEMHFEYTVKILWNCMPYFNP